MKKEEKEIILNSKELIDVLRYLYFDKKFKKPDLLPKFNIQEARFIRDLIFWKPKSLLFHYLADYLMNDTTMKHLPMVNAPSMRRLRFFFNFLGSKSAKEAAIKAGYSPKTAKQQASRALRQIHGHKRVS